MAGSVVVHRILRGLALVLLLSGAVPAWAAQPFAQGMVTITMDDGWSSQYTWARPALQQRGLRSTYYLVTEGVRNGWASYLTAPQVQTILAEGNELGGHTLTHPDLTTLSAAQVEAELRDSQAWLKSQFGLASVPAFASPYGRYTADVLTTAQKYYGSHRTVNGGHNFRDSNILQLRAYDVTSSVSVATVREWIDRAAADGSWLILVFHEFVNGTPTRSTECSVSDFTAILDYVKASNVRNVTVSEGVALSEGRTVDPTGYTFVYDDMLGDGFADWSWATRNLNERTTVYSGLSSMSFEPDAWKSLYFHHASGLDARQYESLELMVHGGTTGGQRVRVEFRDGNTILGSASLDAALGHPLQAGTWQKVSIPFAAVGMSSGTLRDLYIQDGSGGDQGAVYLDEVRLIRAAPRPLSLYADALGIGFSDWSWATRNLNERTTVYAGTSAISFEPDAWKALYFHHGTGIDLSRYTSLELWVHGGTSGGQQVRVQLRDGDTVLGVVQLNTALGHPIQAGTWQRVSIPFSSLGLSAGTLRDLYIQDTSGKDQGTLYIDDLRLVP
ncbi:MAG TPA: polysaccharide deacetylase family protein [Archangium sp.]|jgi:peptidoglycan/xylan/chitin deacetylase (PgdA/CDA1 family)|uniref:polysaccharide deacetylase family protein n=1 Tax=Archangium sp. TaxID=1872627 RepID=UPI002EDAABD9